MYFVRFVSLPRSVEGVVLPNDDNTFDIYVNINLPVERRREIVAHEIKHIKKDHFYDDHPVWANEAEAG